MLISRDMNFLFPNHFYQAKLLGDSVEEKHEVLPEKKPKKKAPPKVELPKEEPMEEVADEAENDAEVEIGQEEPLESVGLSAPTTEDDEYIR